jgi:hypothetical protein
MAKRKTAAEKITDYHELRATAHKLVDILDRRKLRRFLGNHKQLRTLVTPQSGEGAPK